ncbi:MAG: hypothetical protein HFF35_00165 [Oscillospiraceae bacterium]|nr:hypothetical protein [Oscillospiraceae bacterium]
MALIALHTAVIMEIIINGEEAINIGLVIKWEAQLIHFVHYIGEREDANAHFHDKVGKNCPVKGGVPDFFAKHRHKRLVLRCWFAVKHIVIFEQLRFGRDIVGFPML